MMMKKSKCLAMLLSGIMLLGCTSALAEELAPDLPTADMATSAAAPTPSETPEPAKPIIPEEETLPETEQNDTLPALEDTEITEPLKSSSEMTREEYFQSTIDQYADFDYSDPNVISDADFFGIWENGNWKNRTYLNYEKYPGLQLVEEAAKRGDYDAAKEEVLEYYREKFKANAGVPSPLTKRQILTSQALFENLYQATDTKRQVAEIMTVTEEPKTFQVDVLQDMQGVQAGASKLVAYSMIALKKDGYMGVFDSWESPDESARPYVQATINGSTKRFYPVGDATVSPRKNQNTNYGLEPDLKVEESYTSIGVGSGVDEYTKRGYLKFDFKGVEATDKITSATLYLHGKMEKSDNPTMAYEKKTAKDITIWQSTQLNWKNDDVCWADLTHLVFSADGESGPNYKKKDADSTSHPAQLDNEIKYDYTKILTTGYIYRHEEVYAYHALRYILNSIRGIGDDQKQADFKGAHNLGQRTAVVGRIMGLMNSEYMTPEVFTNILKYVYNMAHALVNHWTRQEESNNWGSLQTQGLFGMIVRFQEFREYEDPLVYKNGKPDLLTAGLEASVHGGWMATAKHRLTYKVKKDLFDDGSSIEVGMGYTDLNLGTYLGVLNSMKEADMVPADVFSQEEMDTMVKYGKYMINASTPQLGDWQQGHGYVHSYDYQATIKKLANYVDDPLIQWAATDGDDGEAPEYDSVVYDLGKKAVLRSSWDKKAVAMQINADGGLKSHGQNDDLGLNFYAYGEHFLVDSLYDDYDGEKPSNLFLNSTRGHNTIEINGVSQKGPGSHSGKDTLGNQIVNPGGSDMGDMHPEDRELNKMYDFIQTETVNYQNNSHAGGDFKVTRDILFIKPDYTIVTDYIKPSNSRENTYVQNWHFLPGSNETADPVTNAITTKRSGANLQLVPVNQNTEITVDRKQGLYSAPAGQVTQQDYYGLTKKTAGPATFNTVIYPTKAGEKKTVSTENLPLDVPESIANSFRIRVQDKGNGGTQKAEYYTLLDESKQTLRNFGSHKTDGKTAFVEYDSNLLSTAILRGGTQICTSEGSPIILSSGKTVEDIGIEWKGNRIEIKSSKLQNTSDRESILQALSLYSPVKVNVINVNGEKVAFQQKGACVFFGSEPGFTANLPEHGGDGSGGNGSGGNSNPDGGHGSGIGGGIGSLPGTNPGNNDNPDPNSKIPEEFQKELENHWGKKEITKMVEEKIINGVSDKSLGLQNPVTRAEFITMLVRGLKLDVVAYDGSFSDVSGEDWYADYIATGAANGLIQGYDGLARPNDLLTREEMAKILVMAKGENPEEDAAQIMSDSGEISDWAVVYVNAAISLGIMNGVGDDRFDPQGQSLREQAIVACYRIIYQ